MIGKAANHYDCLIKFKDGSKKKGYFLATTAKIAEGKAKARYKEKGVRSVKCNYIPY